MSGVAFGPALKGVGAVCNIGVGGTREKVVGNFDSKGVEGVVGWNIGRLKG